MRLRLAGLDVSKAGVEYLVKDLRLKDRQVIFNVIKPTTGDSDTADADVTLKKVSVEMILEIILDFLELIGRCEFEY